MDATDHRVLNIRESPTAPELMVATKKMQQPLHPDTRNLITWAHRTFEEEACPFPMVKEAEDILDDLHIRWRQTRDNLKDLADQNHTKDWSTREVLWCLSLPPTMCVVFVCVCVCMCVCVPLWFGTYCLGLMCLL